MRKASKILLAIGAASGVAAYLINKVSSKKDNQSFEDTLELYQSDIEGLNMEEFAKFLHELNKREIPSNLTDEEKTEYLNAVSVLSNNVGKAVARFHESGEMSDEEADAVHQTFAALGSVAKYGKYQMD